MPLTITAAIGAARALYKGYQGIRDSNQAKKLASAPRPQYQIPQTEYDNMNLLGSRANNGLSDATKQLYLDNADRGLSSSVSSVLQGGGSPNDISKLYDNYLGGLNNVSLQDNAAHVNNIDNYINSRYRQSGFLDKQFQLNNMAPWQDQQARAAQLKALGLGEQNAAVNGLVNSVGKYFTPDLDKKDTTTTNLPAQPASYQAPVGYNNGDSPYPIVSPDTINGNSGSTPFYGLDVSRMRPGDAQMVNNLLYGTKSYM